MSRPKKGGKVDKKLIAYYKSDEAKILSGDKTKKDEQRHRLEQGVVRAACIYVAYGHLRYARLERAVLALNRFRGRR